MIDLENVLEEAFRAMAGAMRNAIPGRIITKNPNGTVNAISTVPFRRVNEDTNEVEPYTPPPAVNVPVWRFEGKDGATITIPLEVGQRCFLIFSDRALDNWKAGSDAAPIDLRRFDFADAFCFPGARPPSDPLPSAASDSDHRVDYLPGSMKMRVGSSASVQPVALAPIVDANLTSIATALNVLITAWNAALPAGPVTATGAPLIPIANAATASSKLETE